MKKILLIGASGLVGSRFAELAKNNFGIMSPDQDSLDITSESLIDKYLTKNSFDAVINFAAFTNVDAAEAQRGDESGLAWKLNVEGPKNLSKICKKNGIFLVHISTDFVFQGSEAVPGPYLEDSKLPNSLEGLGWYGWTKNRAEVEVTASGVKNAIIRYGYPFRASPYELKKDWARNLIDLYDSQKLYPLFTDQIQSLLFIDDLVLPLSKIVEEELIGIFHIASDNTTTPYEAGSYLLQKYADKPVELQKGSMVEFLKAQGRTPRPRLGGLKVEMTEDKLKMKFKTWQEMVDEFIAQLKS